MSMFDDDSDDLMLDWDTDVNKEFSLCDDEEDDLLLFDEDEEDDDYDFSAWDRAKEIEENTKDDDNDCGNASGLNKVDINRKDGLPF